MRTVNIHLIVLLLSLGIVTNANALGIFDHTEYESKPHLTFHGGFMEPFLNYISGFETFAIHSTNFDGSSFLNTNFYPYSHKERSDSFGQLSFLSSKYSRPYYGSTSNLEGGGSFFESEKPSPGTAPVPEPATMLLFGSGLAGLAGMSLKRRKK